MILETVKQNTLQNTYTAGSNQISFSDNIISFLDHFQDATEKITSDSKVLLDHLGEDDQECEYFPWRRMG